MHSPTYWSLVAGTAGPLLVWLAPLLLLLCLGGAYLVRTRGASGLWDGFVLTALVVGAVLTGLATEGQAPIGGVGSQLVFSVVLTALLLLPAAVLLAALCQHFRSMLVLGALAYAVSLAIVVATAPWLLLGAGCLLTGNCL